MALNAADTTEAKHGYEPEPEPEPQPELPTTYNGHDRRPAPPRPTEYLRRSGAGGNSPRLRPREYLGVHIYPHLQPALQACERLRPADALGFLAECLLDPEFLLKAAHAPRQLPSAAGVGSGVAGAAGQQGFFAAGSEEKRRLNAALVELNQMRPPDPIGRCALSIYTRTHLPARLHACASACSTGAVSHSVV